MSATTLPSGLTAHELRSHVDCLRATKPPYTCPISNCGRVYKSFSGIQSHLTNFKHEPGDRGDKNNESSAVGHSGLGIDDASSTYQNVAQMSWAQAQKIIDVDVGGKIVRLNTLEPIPLSFVQGGEQPKNEEKKADQIPVPTAVFRELKEFEPSKMDSFPVSYVRFIEKTADELDEEIEYDMDEEDDAWLELVNERRSRVGLPRVSEATFEYVMNRLEKDSYFKTAVGVTPGQDGDRGPTGRVLHDQDDDTVCCVCGDGECENANAILFCDMCNLAAHQECYGVPYIPEGQWLCRRCQLSPSRGVDCRLCPNKGGAFKQTSDNGWAHVVCAMWVPEVQFANTVFLEPIEGFDRIPAARWKLTCYICKQKSRGACIQCHKPSCYTAFHVTCAQQAGLFMKMEPVNDARSPDGGVTVRKSAYCDVHAPTNSNDNGSANEAGKKNAGELAERKSRQPEAQPTPKFDMRRARKLLSQKRNLSPVVSVPVMPRRKLELLVAQLRFAGKQDFLDRILRYWTLKRRSRFGVPLLRRLQVTHHTSRLEKERIRNRELQEQYNSWRQLRQDLEKARLLMELVRKRERKKKENVAITGDIWDKLLSATQRHLIATIDHLEEIDEKRVFTQPVDDDEVPGYSRIIKSPMDLGTMRKKAERMEYKDFAHMEKDFDLMMANCMKFNVQNEYYKSYGTKFKKQGLEILKKANEVYVEMKESRSNFLTEVQAQHDKAGPTSPAPESTPKSTAKKAAGPKAKTPKTVVPRTSNSNSTSSFGDMPTLVACGGQQKENAKLRSGSSKSPSARESEKETTSGVATGEKAPAAKGNKKKNQKAAVSPKTLTPKENKKTDLAAATKTKKKRGSSVTPSTKSGTKKKRDDDDDDDDSMPLRALLGQSQTASKESSAKGSEVFSTPPEGPELTRQSFRQFREDRKSPNSSAVESEIEQASGDEDYLRRTLPSSSALNHDDIDVEHLDFVWAHVEGMPWLPGVVIDPMTEYAPQSAVRFIPPTGVLSGRIESGHLVMLFDEPQSWHWLRRNSLEMLGLEQETDLKMLQHASSSQRAMVTKAYERALEARNLVTGGDSFRDAEDDGGPPVIDEYRSSDEDSDVAKNSKRRSSNAVSRKTRSNSDSN